LIGEIWCYLLARTICAAIYMVSWIVTLAVSVAMVLAAMFVAYWILRLIPFT